MSRIKFCLVLACLVSTAVGLAAAEGVESVVPLVRDGLSRQERVEAEKLCGRLSEIKVLPFKGESVDDPVYNGLRSSGEDSIPCLIKQMSNTTVMGDPRRAPKYKPVRIGDVAFWVLLDITELPYDDMFPEAVRKRFRAEGVYAYFDYVSKYKNRLELQRNVERYLQYAAH